MQVKCFADAPLEWSQGVFSELAEINPRYMLDKNVEYPFVEMASVAEDFGGIIRFDTRKLESSGLSRFKEDDILFGKITPCAENGKVALVKNLPAEFAIGSTEFIVLSPKNGNIPYFVYLLACANPVHGRAVSRMEGSTGRLRITEDVFTKWLCIPIPSKPEQVAIARILDAVDQAITRTQEALEKAQKVKRGLMQDIFGDRKQIAGRIGTHIQEISYGTSQASNDKCHGYPTLRIPNIIDGNITISDLTYVDASARDANQYALQYGDLLLVRTNGNPNYIGRSAVFQRNNIQQWLYASYLIRVRFDEALLPRYVDEYLKSECGRRELFRRVTTSAGNYNINTMNIKSLPIPIIGIDKQIKAVQMADAAIQSIESYNNQCDKLQRLKRGLMQDLLTGKVRTVQPMEAVIP